MADLMKAFILSQDRPFIPQLIQEILNFKSWVNEYLNNGLDILVCHIEMHLFQFFVDEVWWLVMQYKVSPINVLWSPKDGQPYNYERGWHWTTKTTCGSFKSCSISPDMGK